MALPEWLDRLRTGSYISPSGVESSFKFDLLSRSGGKKASIHEILNSNDAIIQEQGNRVKSYPMNIYFVGDTGDQEADRFIQSLEEQYTVSNPGILKHPRWGDVSVIPFEFQQNENYIKGAGIFRVTVEFKESISTRFPTAAGLNESEIVSGINDLEESIDEANSNILVDVAARYAEFKANINGAVDVVVNAIESVASTVKDIDDEFRAIQDDIDRALSVGASAVEIMSQVNRLIRLPAQILDNTIAKVQGYASMIEPLINQFLNNVNPKTNRVGQINNAIMLQSLSSMATGAVIETALFTGLETRDAAGDVIEFINNSSIQVEEAVMSVYQTLSDEDQANINVTTIFSPDHDTFLNLGEAVGQSNTFLIDKSFSLKAKKTTILSAPIDALTATWKLYKDITYLEFFIITNKLTDVEIIEMPSGKTVVSYS